MTIEKIREIEDRAVRLWGFEDPRTIAVFELGEKLRKENGFPLDW